MKSIIVFYEDKTSKYGEEKVFNGKSAVEMSANWAQKFSDKAVSVAADNMGMLFTKMKEICTAENADYVIFSYKDLPFLNDKLTQKLIEFHTKYQAEYTFADGYPYGFAPEILDAGTVGILAELAKTKFAEAGEKKVTRDGIYEFIKNDINSFEVEAVISNEDWRLFRFKFHCGIKENFIACKELFSQIENKNLDADEISQIAAKTNGILKTVPGFYNIQIADSINLSCSFCPYEKCYSEKKGISPLEAKNFMEYEKFAVLADKINFFSENAVVGLSAWGEALNHPEILKFIEKILSYSGLSVLIETDGVNVTPDLCEKIKTLADSAAERTNGWNKIMFIVKMDAFTQKTYEKLHGEKADLAKTVEAIKNLAAVFPHAVYPQFVRLNENEEELESFFRYWNEKTNPSLGELIIQKYDDFAKMLPECKPADLSPIERNICWHLRRDITILSDGSVPFCREYVLDGIIGNAFSEELAVLWNKTNEVLTEHKNNKYNGKCKDCDEYYTYFF